jgi:ATP synthase protein I
MNDRRKKGKEAVRMARLSSVGIAFILCSFIGYGIGYYIDKSAHTRPIFTIIFIIVGTAAGFLNVYRAITKDTD